MLASAFLVMLGAAFLWAGCRTMRHARRSLHEAIAFLLFLAATASVCAAVVVALGWPTRS